MPTLTPRYRALFIAPYPELEPVVRDAARDFPELDVTIHEGDLSAGLAAALGSMDADYDVVVSRGGTAQLLEDEFSIPVFEVSVSPADLYQCLLAHNPNGRRTAIVGFENVLRPLKDVASFSDFDLDIHGVTFEDELPLVLGAVRDGGYEVVLCDTFSLPRCREMGLNAYLLSSGRESVSTAFGEALAFCQHAHELLSRNRMLWNLVSTQDTSFAVFGADGRLTYCNLEQRREELTEFMRGHLEGRREERLVVQRGQHLYRIHKVPVESDGEPYLAFGITRSRMPSARAQVGIRRENRDEVYGRYHASVFCQTHAGDVLAEGMLHAIRSGRPIVLEGEPGSGKGPAADLIYLTSGWDTHPFVKVDCPLVTDRSWAYLMGSPNSPLFAEEATLCFGSVQAMGESRLRELLDMLERSGALRRDHLIVTLSGDVDLDAGAMELLHEHLHFFDLQMPPLRERKDLASAVGLYLNAEARATGTPRPLVTDEGAAVLASYGWPGNYAELATVLQRCMTRADDGRITAEVARSAIGGTKRAAAPSSTGENDLGVDLMRPLRDIERDVVKAAVERCDGNQTEAARVLGVSRTTIWRLLKTE